MATLNSNIPPLIAGETLDGVQMAASNNTGGANTNETDNRNNNHSNNTSQISSNNTISAAADSSDNQPDNPQSNLTNINDSIHNSPAAHPSLYGLLHTYNNTQANTSIASSLIYSHQIYSQSNMDLQQQQLQPHLAATQNSYMNSYEQFYQQQQQQQQNPSQMDYSLYQSATDYKHLRYHPYMGVPASGLASENINPNSQTAPAVSSASSNVMSPRVVSSTSPSSSSNPMPSGSGSSIGSMSAGNPNSPNGAAATLQCKKCGVMPANEAELQEHITSAHGASPYGSSGYASSPYIKEELQQKTPPAQSQQLQQQQQNTNTALQPNGNQAGQPGEILDLDSQKMLYSSNPGLMQPNINSNTDPLHGLHNMQQRAGMSTWDQPAQEAVTGYMPPQHNPADSKNSFYPKAAPTYPNIKTEYKIENQQYIEPKPFEVTNTNEPQQMLPPAVSSSPAEFPSTTTEGPGQDNNQQHVDDNPQFPSGNFEHPSSSSANLPAEAAGAKSANWKSNEPRRPKTYNCTACTKWFTSSGHLKRHYNTTLHKNAVKSSGQPDPSTLPISLHHHPSRDPTGRAGRRGANAANNKAQQRQLPPKPVQPPEPPNSPPDYGGTQMATSGLPSVSHYNGATTSPNSMYQQQQQYQAQQFMPHASPQHTGTMDNHHLQLQQTAINGHPNALAGSSVKPTQQQTPMPSSQMRGLLNTPRPLSVASTLKITKIEHLEAAIIMDVPQPRYDGVTEMAQLKPVKQEFMGVMCSPKDNTALQQEAPQPVESKPPQQYQRLQLQEEAHQHPPNLSTIFRRFQLTPADMEEILHRTIPSNMPALSPHITCQQQYQEQPQDPQQMAAQDTYIPLIQIPSQPQLRRRNTMQHQCYTSIRLATSMPPLPSNTPQPLPPVTTIPTNTNMVSMQPLRHPLMQQPPMESVSMQQQPQLDTINTNIPSLITTTTTHTTPTTPSNIPSYHQLAQPAMVLQQPDQMQISQANLFGNTADTFVSDPHQEFIKTEDGRYFQVLTSNACIISPPATRSSYKLPPTPVTSESEDGNFQQLRSSFYTKLPVRSPLTPESLSPRISSSNSGSPNQNIEYQSSSSQELSIEEQVQPPQNILKTPAVRARAKRASSKLNKTLALDQNPTAKDKEEASTVLPNGRIQCKICLRDFSQICYLTQHINTLHSGTCSYRCSTCGKKFKTEDVYNNHLNIHKTLDKAFKCTECDKGYQHKVDFVRHMQTKHAKILKHKCPICNKGFCRGDHLQKHLETHSRERKRKTSTSGKAKKKQQPTKVPKNVEENLNESLFKILGENSVDPLSPEALAIENGCLLSPTLPQQEFEPNLPSTSARSRQQLNANAKRKRNTAKVIQNTQAANGANNSLEPNQNMYIHNQIYHLSATPPLAKRPKRAKIISNVAINNIEQFPYPLEMLPSHSIYIYNDPIIEENLDDCTDMLENDFKVSATSFNQLEMQE